MTLRGHHEARELELLVLEWRDAIQYIDSLTLEERRLSTKPLERMMEAHNALYKYAVEKLE